MGNRVNYQMMNTKYFSFSDWFSALICWQAPSHAMMNKSLTVTTIFTAPYIMLKVTDIILVYGKKDLSIFLIEYMYKAFKLYLLNFFVLLKMVLLNLICLGLV